ncbi:MAG: aminotransferase class V-fold PLP-dependent enzyme, partial [Bacteroidales bacterium]|nr:aminotransferase class V-fold PLP-dependent enzyme [Bacteroidales bacterium]
IRYITKLGIDKIAKYENSLLAYTMEKLSGFDRIRFYGTARAKAPVISFLIDGIHPYDTGMVLDKLGIAVRTGTHCAQPLMDFFDVDGTVRVSLAFYNTYEEIDRLVDGIRRVIAMFG